jgi:acyl-CoA synthetase (AMP-forming)/AMP-acid ligase II
MTPPIIEAGATSAGGALWHRSAPTAIEANVPWDDCDTIVRRFRRRARVHGNQPALAFIGADGATEELTWSDLDRRARAVAASLQAVGATGQRAVLLIPPSIDYVVAFLGCLYAEVIAVPTYPPRNAKSLPQLGAVIADAKAAFAISTRSIAAELGKAATHIPDIVSMYWLNVDDLVRGIADDWQEPLYSDEKIVFLQYTSGSTAAPRGVVLTHGCVRHNMAMIAELLELSTATRMLVWLPLYHDMGLIGATLGTLYSGGSTMLMAPATFLQRPFSWLEAISKYGANVTGAPNFAFDLCVRKASQEQIESLDLSRLGLVFVGAEPVWPETLNRFTETFSVAGFRHEAFYPCYGLAEASLIVTGSRVNTRPYSCAFRREAIERHRVERATTADKDTLELVACGRPPRALDVRIVNPETRTACTPNRIGEIWVAGPSVAQGYWNNPDATRETFEAFLTDCGTGPYLRTGDLGFFLDGQLFITGRLKDLIIIGGRNLHPQDIEMTAMNAHASIRPGGSAAFALLGRPNEELAIVVETDRSTSAETDWRTTEAMSKFESVCVAVRRAVSEQLDVSPYRIIVAPNGAIPRTSSGKIQRRVCRSLYVNGKLEVCHEG